VEAPSENRSQPSSTRRGTCLHRPYHPWAKAQAVEETRPNSGKNPTQGIYRTSREPPNQALPSHHKNSLRKATPKARENLPHPAFQPPRQGLMYMAWFMPKKNQHFRPHMTTTLAPRHSHTASNRSKRNQELTRPHPHTAVRPPFLRLHKAPYRSKRNLELNRPPAMTPLLPLHITPWQLRNRRKESPTHMNPTHNTQTNTTVTQALTPPSFPRKGAASKTHLLPQLTQTWPQLTKQSVPWSRHLEPITISPGRHTTRYSGSKAPTALPCGTSPHTLPCTIWHISSASWKRHSALRWASSVKSNKNTRTRSWKSKGLKQQSQKYDWPSGPNQTKRTTSFTYEFLPHRQPATQSHRGLWHTTVIRKGHATITQLGW
jgi:hypothetical protein